MTSNRKKKNKIVYFYQIISDLKNNLDTLVKEIYENKNNLDEYANMGKSVLKKSKYPDLKKLGILEKNDKWSLTQVGKELLEIFEGGNEEQYHKMIASILGSYSYNGFRPYAVLCKFLYIKFGLKEELSREDIVRFFSLPINEALYYINNERNSSFVEYFPEEQIEASRPYSYVVNHLRNAGLIIELENGYELSENIEEFLDIFFSDIEEIPKSKAEINNNKYRITSRGKDQVAFREELLRVYKNRCAITRGYCITRGVNLLEAAHIIPVSHGGSYEVSNGILMTPNLHKAFDSGVFTFDENYNLIEFPETEEENYLPKDKKIVNLPDREVDKPSINSINYHGKYIFGIGVINSKK